MAHSLCHLQHLWQPPSLYCLSPKNTEHVRQCFKSFAHGWMDGSDLSEMSINRLTARVFNFERGFRSQYMGDPRWSWQPHKAEGTKLNNSSQDPGLEMEKADTERILGIQGGFMWVFNEQICTHMGGGTPQDRGRATWKALSQSSAVTGLEMLPAPNSIYTWRLGALA